MASSIRLERARLFDMEFPESPGARMKASRMKPSLGNGFFAGCALRVRDD
jgi:hypothetical protein